MNCSFCWGVARSACDAGITCTKLRATATGGTFGSGFDAFGAVVFFSESLSDSRGMSIFAASFVSASALSSVTELFSAISFSAVTVSFGDNAKVSAMTDVVDDAGGSTSAFAVPASLTFILSAGLALFAVTADAVAATDTSSGASLVAALSLLVMSGLIAGRAATLLSMLLSSSLSTALSTLATSLSTLSASVSGVCNH